MLAEDPRTSPSTQGELVCIYPNRSAVPHDAWSGLLKGAKEEADILVFSGLFLVEQLNLLPIIREKAGSGTSFHLQLDLPVRRRNADKRARLRFSRRPESGFSSAATHRRPDV